MWKDGGRKDRMMHSKTQAWSTPNAECKRPSHPTPQKPIIRTSHGNLCEASNPPSRRIAQLNNQVYAFKNLCNVTWANSTYHSFTPVEKIVLRHGKGLFVRPNLLKLMPIMTGQLAIPSMGELWSMDIHNSLNSSFTHT